jgi:hypothetical protein
MKKKVTRLHNAVDPATTNNKAWGFVPVANKGGKTTNFEIPADMFKRELKEYLEGINEG